MLSDVEPNSSERDDSRFTSKPVPFVSSIVVHPYVMLNCAYALPPVSRTRSAREELLATSTFRRRDSLSSAL
jgi:hypothetical protein